jgi:ribonuclease T1
MPLRFVPRVLVSVLLVLLAGCAESTETSAPSWADRLPTVRLSDLPAEARETLALVDRGGPFPYERDGAVFGNFERLLPAHERGGELYYTDDHYDSFRAVLR